MIGDAALYWRKPDNVKRAYVDGRYGQMHYRIAVPPQADTTEHPPIVFFHQSPSSGRPFEGLVSEMKAALENVNDMTGSGSGKIIGVSGGFRNPLIKQLKADIVGHEFHLPAIEEASTLGAALLGGIGAGVYSSHEEAAEAIDRKEVVVKPNSENKSVYDRAFKIYKDIYQSLRNVSHSIDW